MSDASRPSVRRLPWIAAGAALMVGGALGWSANELLAPAPPTPTPRPYSVYVAQPGSVSRGLTLKAAAAWGAGAAVNGRLAGTVTSVDLRPDATVEPGDVLYRVGLSPVFAAAGSTPAFRSLAAGARGKDVEQLQSMLVTLGWRRAEPNGRYDEATRSRVRAWQRSTGQQVTGDVALGQVLFVPQLPAVLRAAPSLAIGSDSPVGAPAVSAQPASPRFTISLPPGQAALVSAGHAVQLRMEDVTWSAKVASVGPPDESGSAIAVLGPASGTGHVCADQCARIPASGSAPLQATITIVPTTSGVTVPTSSLAVAPDNRTEVVLEDGSRRAVTVRASSSGRAVVDGLPAGSRVRIGTAGDP